MNDLSPEKRAELRKLAKSVVTTVQTPWYSAEEFIAYGVESEDDAAYIAALPPATVLGLLDATEPVDTAEVDLTMAELRRDAESWTMVGGERVLPLLNAYDALRAERDALAAKLDAAELRRTLGLSIRNVLRAELGHEQPLDPHSWRCADKVRYPGPCGCADAVADMAVAAALAEDQTQPEGETHG